LHVRLPQLEDAATSPHRHADPPFPRRQGKRLRGEEMGPQIPVGVNPQKSLANRREDGRLRDGVGVEIVQLHPIVMQERPHETACSHSEPLLMEGDETQHIPRRRGRGGPARRDHPLWLRVTREGTEQAIGNKGLKIVHRDGGERPRVARRNDGYPVYHRQAKGVAAERTRPGQDPFNTSPEPAMEFKLEGETPVPRTARATAAPQTTRPVALTLRQGMRHLWQAKRATLHLRHDDRVKKGVPHRSISYPFPLPLSLSCYRDWERGYSERDPSPRRKRAPSPPTDQGFEGWPLGRVRQPPQSTWAPRPLVIRGSKAGPSEGFDSRLRALGLRAHY
jgi:hypothetical protein